MGCSPSYTNAVSDCCGAEIGKEITLPSGAKCFESDYPGIKRIVEEQPMCENCHHYDFCKSRLTADECCYFKVV